MRIIARSTLKSFWSKPEYSDSEQALKAWFEEAEKAEWKRPNDIRIHYRSASIIGNDRVVFNICGNKYRLVAAIKYDFRIIYIRFIGTHKQYDKINVKEI
ncbi:MAG: type II toxin-antitoxin system HigB family toxin [Candidatus Omnitrophica bacterium]|nr:type II toxin-antitoxin system HigB family toxin [Candidatus Omnitrophota bacterium]